MRHPLDCHDRRRRSHEVLVLLTLLAFFQSAVGLLKSVIWRRDRKHELLCPHPVLPDDMVELVVRIKEMVKVAALHIQQSSDLHQLVLSRAPGAVADPLAERTDPAFLSFRQHLVVVELQAETAVSPVALVVLKAVAAVLLEVLPLPRVAHLRLDDEVDRLSVVHLHVEGFYPLHRDKRRDRMPHRCGVVAAFRQDQLRFVLLALVAETKLVFCVFRRVLTQRVDLAPVRRGVVCGFLHLLSAFVDKLQGFLGDPKRGNPNGLVE